MKTNIQFILSFIVISLTVVILSCTKDSPVIELKYNPTPIKLEIPEYVTTYLGEMPVPADNILTKEGVELGRKLFYDNKLSDDLSMNCSTCHKQENTFTDPRQYSRGTNGAYGERNAMITFNLGWSTSYFWDGRRNTLEEQAHDPVSNPIEMRNDWKTVVKRLQADKEYPNLFFYAFGTSTIDSNLVTKAIAQFERTMLSFNSPYDRYNYLGERNILNSSQKRGFNLYYGMAECIHCHYGPLLTDNTMRNNGLDNTFADLGYGKVTGKSTDNGKFRIPTLRNIELTAPYMHDGRYKTLEEVVEHYNSGVVFTSPNLDVEMNRFTGGLNLTTQQKADLINFLKSFTDDQFVTNPKFSEPK
jgi:cytochrome c peroxidase